MSFCEVVFHFVVLTAVCISNGTRDFAKQIQFIVISRVAITPSVTLHCTLLRTC